MPHLDLASSLFTCHSSKMGQLESVHTGRTVLPCTVYVLGCTGTDSCTCLLTLDDQSPLGEGCCVQDVVDDVCQVMRRVLDGFDVVGALLSQLPGSTSQHGLRQACMSGLHLSKAILKEERATGGGGVTECGACYKLCRLDLSLHSIIWRLHATPEWAQAEFCAMLSG